jgi:prophage regulatory protein
MAKQVQTQAHPERLITLPEVLSIYPIGKSTFWAGIRTGRYPKPQRISARRVAWRESDILELIRSGRQS